MISDGHVVLEALPFEQGEALTGAVSKQDPEAKPQATKTGLIPANDRGVLRGSNFDDQYRLANAYFKSGLMPRGLNSPEKVMVAVQLLYELNLPVVTSVGKVCVINGTASIFGDLPLALVQRSGLMEHIAETQTDELAICTVKRRGQPEVQRSFSMGDAKVAGLLGKDPWKAYPKRMLQMRSRSWALKDAFPDVLMGISIAEYDHNATVVDGKLVGGGEDGGLAQEINSAYLGDVT